MRILVIRTAGWTTAGALLLLLTACGDSGGNPRGTGGTSAVTTSNGGAAAATTAAGLTGPTSTAETDAESSGAGGAGTVCPDGTTLIRTIADCAASAPTPDALVVPLSNATRGGLVDVDSLDAGALPCLAALVCRPDDAPTLLFSDEPETVQADGILYAEELVPNAPYRVYVYHVNGGAVARKFSVVALNQGTSDALVHISARASAGPGGQYIQIGKDVATALLNTPATSDVTVPAGARVVLDPVLDGLHPMKNELVHAILDLTADRPLKLSVVSVGANADAAAATAGLSVIPNSGLHVRGTFPGAAFRIVAVNAAAGRQLDGVRALRFGAGAKEMGDADPDLAGTSFLDRDMPVTLLGNFGATYRISAPFAVRSAVLISPRGGAWAAGAQIATGEDAGAGAIALPTGSEAVDPDAAVFAGRFAAREATDLTLLTAGGSSLPIVVAFTPLPD